VKLRVEPNQQGIQRQLAVGFGIERDQPFGID
jgi:hypothetical protein